MSQPPSDDDWGPDPGRWGEEPPPASSSYSSASEPSPRPPPPAPSAATPSNYLVHSILATLFCCLPTGIVGIVYASQVNGKYAAGDVAGAARAAQNARLWTIVSVVAGLVVGTIYLMVYAASM